MVMIPVEDQPISLSIHVADHCREAQIISSGSTTTTTNNNNDNQQYKKYVETSFEQQDGHSSSKGDREVSNNNNNNKEYRRRYSSCSSISSVEETTITTDNTEMITNNTRITRNKRRNRDQQSSELNKQQLLVPQQQQLYGREMQLKQLFEAYEKRVTSCSWHSSSGGVEETAGEDQTLKGQTYNELVLITGPSGSGKTTLAYRLRDEVLIANTKSAHQMMYNHASSIDVHKSGAYFLSGKFDRYRRGVGQSYCPLISVFSDFTDQIFLRYPSAATKRGGRKHRRKKKKKQCYNSTCTSTSSSIDNHEQHDDEMFIMSMREAVDKAVGSEMDVLIQAIPSLRCLFQDINKNTTSTAEDGGPIRQNSSRKKKATNASRKDAGDHNNNVESCEMTASVLIQDDVLDNNNENDDEKNMISTTLDKITQNHFAGIFRRFMTALCDCLNQETVCPTIILLLDDLQNADINSVQLIKELLVCKIPNLMVIGTCRDNEVTINDELAIMLRHLEDNHNISINQIHTPNLGADSIKEMIMDRVVEMSSVGTGGGTATHNDYDEDSASIVSTFAESIYNQTDGNIFFIQEMIRSLHEEGFIYTNDGKWIWKDNNSNSYGQRRISLYSEDNASVTSSCYNNDDTSSSDCCMITRLLVKKLKSLPIEVQELLKIASCVGGTNEFPKSLLPNTGITVFCDIQSALSIAEERGFITILDSDDNDSVSKSISSGDSFCGSSISSFNGDGTMLKFTHDKFQEAAYSLAHGDQLFHLNLGRKLRDSLLITTTNKDGEQRIDSYQDHHYLLLVVDLMKFGCNLIDDPKEKYDFVVLCLNAGRRSVESSSFLPGMDYLELGIHILSTLTVNQNHWIKHYDLSLELHNTAAEVAHCIGDHQRVDDLLGEIFNQGQSFADKFQAHCIRIYSLGARGNLSESISVGLQVLKDECGMKNLPRKPNILHVAKEFVRTKMMMGGRNSHLSSNESILNLQPLTDHRILASLSLLQMLQSRSIFSEPLLAPLIAFKFVQLTLRYGLHAMSSFGFAFYGSFLIQLKKFPEGMRYGNLAMEILNKYPTELDSRTHILLWVLIWPSRYPLQRCCKPLKNIHRKALANHDIETSLLCGTTGFELLAGTPFPELLKMYSYYHELCTDYKSEITSSVIKPVYQACLNFVDSQDHGEDSDPIVLTGALMDEKEEFQKYREAKNHQAASFLWYQKLILAIYFNRFEEAYTFLRQIWKVKYTLIPVHETHALYYAGLSAAINGKIRIARKHHRAVRQWGRYYPQSVLHKLELIEAEIFVQKGHLDRAMMKFDRSIALSKRENYINQQALANERAGITLLKDKTRKQEAFHYLEESVSLYEKWGASRKVKQMRKEYWPQRI